jgi:dihydropteroate synthase
VRINEATGPAGALARVDTPVLQGHAVRMPDARALPHRTGVLQFGTRPLIMGVVNVTPDSFSDGGERFRAEDAISGARQLAAEGADILDIGAESTRPGHVPLSADDEWARLAPVLAALGDGSALPPISIDTSKADIARRALAAGASMVNDVWGLRRDPNLASVAANAGAAVVLMHNRDAIDGTVDIVAEILAVLDRSVAIATAAGVPPDRIVLDPGIGFGKTLEQNYQAVAALPRLKALGFPVLLGVSRKSFIGRLFDPQPAPQERLPGTLAANLYGALAGADILRVHDVAPHVQALRVLARIRSAA